jgi:SAM-dependent methyltransferase
MFEIIAKILFYSPFYPHWLERRNRWKTQNGLLMLLYGKVLETGCGNAIIKDRALQANKKIKKYIATDYSSWDEEFEAHAKNSNAFGKVTQILLSRPKQVSQLDGVCDAQKLPYKDQTFDCYCSFQVLEHIEEPLKFFKEAQRVLKKGGICIIVMPFLYREHSGVGEANDYQRFTPGGFTYLAKKTGFTVIDVKTASCFGTTTTSLTNGWVIRKIVEGNLFIKIILFLLSPFIFFITNIVGFLIDSVDKDARFALEYSVIMEKN